MQTSLIHGAIFLGFSAQMLIKARLAGAQKGHGLLKKKADALQVRFRMILGKIIEVSLLWFLLLYSHDIYVFYLLSMTLYPCNFEELYNNINFVFVIHCHKQSSLRISET